MAMSIFWLMRASIKERARKKLFNWLLCKFLNGCFVRASETERCYLGEASRVGSAGKVCTTGEGGSTVL